MFWDFSSISWFWKSNKTQLFTRPKYRYTGITGIFFPVYRYRNFLIPNIPREQPVRTHHGDSLLNSIVTTCLQACNSLHVFTCVAQWNCWYWVEPAGILNPGWGWPNDCNLTKQPKNVWLKSNLIQHFHTAMLQNILWKSCSCLINIICYIYIYTLKDVTYIIMLWTGYLAAPNANLLLKFWCFNFM